MGRVNNPQAGELALVERANSIGRLSQPLSFASDAVMRDVLSPEAELSRYERKISLDAAKADQMPLTGRNADLVDAALGRGRIVSQSGDAARSAVRNAEMQKRLKFTESRVNRLAAASGHSQTRAIRDQQDAEARQQKKNTKKAALANFAGTLFGAGVGAYANTRAASPPPQADPYRLTMDNPTTIKGTSLIDDPFESLLQGIPQQPGYA